MDTLSLPMTKRSGSETTNGHYPSDVLQRQVVEWIKFTLQRKHDPPLSKPLTTHLDVLLDFSIARENLVAVSFQTYQLLVQQLEVLGIPDTITPTLHIPLEMTEALIIGPIDAEALMKQIDYNEPPSLYLTECDLQTKLNAIERYDFPSQDSDFVEDAEAIYIRYSAWRTLEDIENGWEYGRSIVAEYYPKVYQYLP